jgi:hypothetical protein
MNNLIQFVEIAGAIITALGLAMAMEWLALSGLLRLMPLHAKHSAKVSQHSTKVVL